MNMPRPCHYIRRYFQRYLLAPMLALSLLMLGALSAVAGPAQTGLWEMGPNFPWYPLHVHILPNGKVMMWPGSGVSGDDARTYDPVFGTITQLANPGYDVYCSAHLFLPDGRLFVAGGNVSNSVGLADATVYDPVANSWTRQPRMNLGRFYPTSQLLPNGDVVVVSGNVDITTGSDPLPQVWQAATGTWRDLGDAQLQQPLYPYMFIAPNGKPFDAGPSIASRYLDTNGSGAWSFVTNHIFTARMRDYGGAVMYQPGKILNVGGGDPPTNVAEVIDLNSATPKWRSVGSMANNRRHMNTTVLPDGKVLGTGGTKGAGFNNFDPGNPIYVAEMWDPATEQWTLMESATITRVYHSLAILLPDARVLSTGGNGYTQTEIFSPPYLFAGPRPTLTSAPAAVAKGQSLFLATPDATTIDTVSWIRLGSLTHGTNMNQGVFFSTAITQASGGITITAPNLTTVPAGHYMLFLMRGGVPSIAKIVRLDANYTNPVPALTSISPSSANAGAGAFTLTVNGSNFVNGTAVRWNGVGRPTTFVSATQLRADIPASDITAAGTAQVTVSSPTPGGGNSNALTFTINPPAAGQNLAGLGTIIARVTAPTGGGSKNIGLIRDGVRPPVGSTDSSLQYDTWDGNNTAPNDWIGYQFTSPYNFNRVVFQEGKHFGNGGWFTTLTVQVRQAGNWVNVSNLSITPAYPGVNNGVNFETYTLQFTPMSGDAIRIFGDPGGSADFISVAELEVYAAPQTQQNNLAGQGTIIARVTAPTGGGSKNIGLIRDGVTPPVGSTDSSLQYDTYDGANTSPDDWIGYQFSSSQTFNRVVFQEGKHFANGGWFTTLTVQVRQAGTWVNVSNLSITPAYPGVNNGVNFETYTLQFTPISGDAIRIYGDPGGSADFISVGELEVYGQ